MKALCGHGLDAHTITFADCAQRRRIKVWGTARVVEDDAPLLRRLMPANYPARAEQVLLFTVTAWDVNCPQHIPQRFEAAEVAAAIEQRDQRIAALEAEVAALRQAAPPTGVGGPGGADADAKAQGQNW